MTMPAKTTSEGWDTRPILVPADDEQSVRELFRMTRERAIKYLPTRLIAVGGGKVKRFFVVREVDDYLTTLPVDTPGDLSAED